MLDRTAADPAGCRACATKTRHRPEDWMSHPLAGHGYGATEHGIGWSSEEAQAAHVADVEAAKRLE